MFLAPKDGEDAHPRDRGDGVAVRHGHRVVMHAGVSEVHLEILDGFGSLGDPHREAVGDGIAEVHRTVAYHHPPKDFAKHLGIPGF